MTRSSANINDEILGCLHIGCSSSKPKSILLLSICVSTSMIVMNKYANMGSPYRIPCLLGKKPVDEPLIEIEKCVVEM